MKESHCSLPLFTNYNSVHENHAILFIATVKIFKNRMKYIIKIYNCKLIFAVFLSMLNRQKSRNSFNQLLVVLATFNTIFIAFTILDYSLARGGHRFLPEVVTVSCQRWAHVLVRGGHRFLPEVAQVHARGGHMFLPEVCTFSCQR